jgi:hypothetical protein
MLRFDAQILLHHRGVRGLGHRKSFCRRQWTNCCSAFYLGGHAKGSDDSALEAHSLRCAGSLRLYNRLKKAQ